MKFDNVLPSSTKSGFNEVNFFGQNKSIIFPIFIETKKTYMIHGNGVRWTLIKENEYKMDIDVIF